MATKKAAPPVDYPKALEEMLAVSQNINALLLQAMLSF
jgi:hypothetical protein